MEMQQSLAYPYVFYLAGKRRSGFGSDVLFSQMLSSEIAVCLYGDHFIKDMILNKQYGINFSGDESASRNANLAHQYVNSFNFLSSKRAVWKGPACRIRSGRQNNTATSNGAHNPLARETPRRTTR